MLISDWSSDVCSSDLYYRPSRKDPPGTRRAWPAMIALVTNLAGAITGVHRTWFDPTTIEKAPVAYPTRAMGHLLGHALGRAWHTERGSHQRSNEVDAGSYKNKHQEKLHDPIPH